jgi:membrane protein
MPNIVTIIKKGWEFVSTKIWHIRLNKIDKRQGFFLKQLRIFTLAVKGFNEDNCLTKASALTFYTLFSIVPILALVFAIAKSVGYDKTLQNQLLTNYGTYQDVLQKAFVYADSMLANTKGGLIAGLGIVLLLWSVMKLLVSIEANFNEIFEIKKGRTWVRKITDYLTIMLLSPLLLIVSGGITVAVNAKMGNLHMLGFVSSFFAKLLAYGLITGVFVFLYMVLPNTKVKFKSALAAAFISMILFEILQWAYIKFQIGASSFNAIYGGFAALPLFLIWIQYSWYVVLFGAELAFANQNVDHYELENEIKNLSIRYKKVIALMIANLVAKRFYAGESSLNAEKIAEILDLPVRLARNIVNEFVETAVFVEVKTEVEKEIVYQPAVTESKFTVKYIFDALEVKGVNELPISDTLEHIHITELMKELDNTMNTDLGRLLVKDIVK